MFFLDFPIFASILLQSVCLEFPGTISHWPLTLDQVKVFYWPCDFPNTITQYHRFVLFIFVQFFVRFLFLFVPFLFLFVHFLFLFVPFCSFFYEDFVHFLFIFWWGFCFIRKFRPSVLSWLYHERFQQQRGFTLVRDRRCDGGCPGTWSGW